MDIQRAVSFPRRPAAVPHRCSRALSHDGCRAGSRLWPRPREPGSRPGATGVETFPPRQPELSNEPLALVSDFAAGACFAAGALLTGLAAPPVEGSSLLAGVLAMGVVVDCVVLAGVKALEVLGITELGTPA